MISTSNILLFFIIAGSLHSADGSFYITNVGAIRQCSTGKPLYLKLFDIKQMSCVGRTWRHITANIAYVCEKNQLTNFWTLQTTLNPTVAWPSKVHLFTLYDKTNVQTVYSITLNREKESMDETSRPFDPAQNSFVSYLWIPTVGPYCRLKYAVIKDICSAKQGQRAELRGPLDEKSEWWNDRKRLLCLVNEFICDYRAKDYSLTNAKDRETFDKLINDITKTSTNSTSNNSTNGNGNEQTIDLGSPDPSALAKGSNLKTIIFVAVGAVAAVGVVGIVLYLLRRKPVSEKNFEHRKSIESTGD